MLDDLAEGRRAGDWSDRCRGFVRDGSGHPCDRLVHGMASKSGMPKLVIEGVILAQLRGDDPTPGACVSRWVDLHVNGLEPQFMDQ